MNSVAVNIPVRVFLLDVYSGEDLRGNEVFSVFAAVATQVFKVVVPVSLLSAVSDGCSLHILLRTCYLLSFSFCV